MPWVKITPEDQKSYSFEALERFHGHSNQGSLAAACQVTRRTIGRWKVSGLSIWVADRAAAHLGAHPTEIWSDWS